MCGEDVQARNIGPLAAAVRGSLRAAAASIAGHGRPAIGIITGFYLAHGEPPNCETDGPPGAVMLAAGLAAAGIPCRLATDRVNERVLRATLAAAGPAATLPLDIVAMRPEGGDGGQPLAAAIAGWQAARLSHVIAIERCGPSADGAPRNAFGQDIAAWNAPLERLFAGPWTTIGIGDLGNELGMGSLPRALVAASVRHGAAIWCRVPCDHPLVGGISNWAGAALLGALALLRPGLAAPLLAAMAPAFGRRLLEAAVRDGEAVSGDPKGGPVRPWLSVDGLPWSRLEPTFAAMQETCRTALAQAAGRPSAGTP
ncbi:MAG: DUF4392 domain-containing protein [Dongiaceae bacterium]